MFWYWRKNCFGAFARVFIRNGSKDWYIDLLQVNLIEPEHFWWLHGKPALTGPVLTGLQTFIRAKKLHMRLAVWEKGHCSTVTYNCNMEWMRAGGRGGLGSISCSFYVSLIEKTVGEMDDFIERRCQVGGQSRRNVTMHINLSSIGLWVLDVLTARCLG